MDASGKLKKLLGNNKGVAFVYIAITLFVLIAFLGLAVDIGYMYVVKGQLQNAADASALAGAAKLDGTIFTIQNPARTEAIKFADQNKAAGYSVTIASNPSSNDFNDTNDIRFGYWDGTTFKLWGSPGIPSNAVINAIQVRTRRNDTANPNSPQRQVDVFFGQIFRIINSNWSKMSAVSVATASRPPKSTMNIALCIDSCIGTAIYPAITTISPPRAMKIGTSSSHPVVPDNQQMAWTNQGGQPITNTNDLTNAICNGPTNDDVCGITMYATMANPPPVIASMQSAFSNPNYDVTNDPQLGKKTEFVEYTGLTQTVWWVVVPILNSCAVTIEGAANDPKLVVSYALIRIIGVCKNSPGNPDPCGGAFPAPAICSNPTFRDSIVIDRMSCLDCADKEILFGARPALVSD
ncbi:MAG: pilus assembly protein TadG-related protein [Geobacteraceae bacterium]